MNNSVTVESSDIRDESTSRTSIGAEIKIDPIKIHSDAREVVVRGLPTSRFIPDDSLVETIIRAVSETKLESFDFELISNTFFYDSDVESGRISNGVVETPKEVADYIVRSALSSWRQTNKGLGNSFSVLSNLSWLDPCVGGGVFPCAILQMYFDQLGSKNIADLPRIKVFEIAPIGIATTLCNIKKLLETKRLDFEEYVLEEKISIVCGDFLKHAVDLGDLFSDLNKSDIVVGNPPYVRSTRLTQARRKEIRKLFPTIYSGGADLYTYFVAGGINLLRSKGILAFISPVAFSRAKSGQSLRRWMSSKIALDTFIDLDETQVFPDADLHSAIYVLVKDIPQKKNVKHLVISDREKLEILCQDKCQPKRAIFEFGTDVWSIHTSRRKYTKFASTFSNTVTLSELNLGIFSGIRPGYKAAFVLNETESQSFSPQVRDKWIKPIAIAPKIERWKTRLTNDYIIVIPAGTEVIDGELHDHLSIYKDRLINRPEVKDERYWHNLRSCSYYARMEKRKIGFPDLSATQRFSVIAKGTYLMDGAYFIDTDDPIFLAILNSEAAREYFEKRCSSVGSLSTGGRFRFKKTFLQEFRVPQNILDEGDLQDEVRKVTKNILRYGENEERLSRINSLVLELYG